MQTERTADMSHFGNPSYGLVREITGRDFATVVESTRAALAAEGFGVLTEIDVRQTFAKKLNVEFDDYLILGACNPTLAHQALTQERGLGLLLPCNVVLSREGDRVVVAAIDPEVMFSVVGDDALAPVATEVRARLLRVLEAV